MGEGERCGSVTDLLQGSVDLYVPPSPRHHPPPDPDCWGETNRAPKHDKDKAADTTLSTSIPGGDAQKTTDGKDQLEDRSKAREHTENSSRASDRKSTSQGKAEAELKTAKEKNKSGIKPKKTKPGSTPDQGKPRGATTEKVRPGAKTDKTQQGNKTPGRGKHGSGDDHSLLPPPKPRPGV